MEKSTKTILLAVFILLIAIVSFNFTGMTGMAVGKPTIEVVTKTVHRGENVIVDTAPGNTGIYNRYMYIYRTNGARIGGTRGYVCGTHGGMLCKSATTVTYNSLGTYDKYKWPLGKYIVKAIDGKGNEVTDAFKIVE